MHEYLVSYRGKVFGEDRFGDIVISTDQPLKSTDMPLVRTLIADARAKDGRLEIACPVVLGIHKFGV
jgi:hypothetical protein